MEIFVKDVSDAIFLHLTRAMIRFQRMARQLNGRKCVTNSKIF